MGWFRRRVLRWLEGEHQETVKMNVVRQAETVSYDADFRIAIHKAENGTIVEFLQTNLTNYTQGNTLSVGLAGSQPKSASNKRYIVVPEGDSVADAIVVALIKSKIQ